MKSEREKMLSSELYYFLDPELNALREAKDAVMWRYNTTPSREERLRMLPELIGRAGIESQIEAPFHCSYGRHIELGDYAYINYACTILDNARVMIGDHTMIGPHVQIYTAAHPLDAEPRIRYLEIALPITIGARVWIGGGAIILPGVTIGDSAVVGAGSVVTKDVAPYTVVAGNPARVLRVLEASEA